MKFFTGLTLLLLASITNIIGQDVTPGFDLSNYGVRIEPDKRVIVVLATLEAARTQNDKGEPVPLLNTRLSEA